MSIHFIGDVHGQYGKYLKLMQSFGKDDFSIQVGDFGFQYDCLKSVDPNKHKVLGGNHDDFSKLSTVPHNLGSFGIVNLGGIDVFFVRGACSIDANVRIPGRDWWPEEELTIREGNLALESYLQLRPKLVVSHDCPDVVRDLILGRESRIKTRTGQLLQAMFDRHQPERWIFGHHHVHFRSTIEGTEFRCVEELRVETIESEPKEV